MPDKKSISKAWDNFKDFMSGALEGLGEVFKLGVEGASVLGIISGIFIFVVFCIAIGPAIFMWIWNALIPGLTGWREINFWEAMGIVILARILFGNSSSSNSSKN